MSDNCLKTSNNKYFGCPPRMSDGRHFTDYRGNCYVNNLVRANNNTYNNYQYRMFLTKNADDLMHMNRKNANQKNGCSPCQKPYNIGTMMPECGTIDCSKSSCNFSSLDKDCLGTGRTYSNQPLGCSSWNDDPSLVSKNSCSTPEDNFSYYHGRTNEQERLSVPSGGLINDYN